MLNFEEVKFDKNTIFVLAVTNNEEMGEALLNSVFKDLSKVDSQEWTTKYGDFTLRCFTKFTDCDINRKTPPFADITLGQCNVGIEKESDVLNYLAVRGDSKHVLLIDSNLKRKVEKDVVVIGSASDVLPILDKYTEELKVHNSENEKTDDPEDLHNARNEWNPKKDSDQKFINFDFLNFLRKTLDSFAICYSNFSAEPETYTSTYEGNGTIKPEDGESNGMGVLFNVFFGEEYRKQNPNLPLTVRDTYATYCLELFCKNEEGTEAVLSMLETAKGMAAQFGLIEKLEDGGIAKITFSKEGKSVWVDITVHFNLGEEFISKIRSLHLDKYKLSLNGQSRLQTNVNVKDIYNEPNFESIFSNLSLLTFENKGTLLNMKAVGHIIKDVIFNMLDSDGNKKFITIIGYIILILSSFKNLDLEFIYNSQDLKTSIEAIIEALLYLEHGQVTEMIKSQNEAFKMEFFQWD